MGHYTVNYEGVSGDAKVLQALEDIDIWFNDGRVYIEELDRKLAYQTVLFDIATSGVTLKGFRMTMAFVGVEGYPVAAFWKDAKDALHTMTQ